MSLPFSFSGRVEVDARHDVNGAALRLERGLEILKAKRIDRTESQIRFKAGYARLVSNTNLLAPISSGELAVQPKGGGLVVVYRLRFTQMLVFVTVMVFGFFGPSLLNAANRSKGQAVVYLFGMWMWLFGGSVVTTLIRFPRWIRRTLV
jgi:hypothetical protein